MDSLPIELLDIIASHGSSIYYGLLGYKFFADTLKPGKIVDYMILFGHSVKINKYKIEWYLKDCLHRTDGPAIEYIRGSKQWYLNGVPHRDSDLPAHEDNDGYKAWYRYGKRHRDNGPAIIWHTGHKEWFKNGDRYTGVTIIKDNT